MVYRSLCIIVLILTLTSSLYARTGLSSMDESSKSLHLSDAEIEVLALKEAGISIPQELYDLVEKQYRIESEVIINSGRQGGDTIEEAVEVELDNTYNGTTAGYTDDYDEQCPYTGSTSPDVVYLLTLEEDTGFTLDLCDAGYDSKLYVYSSDLNLMGCSDDDCGVQSEFLLELIPADDYYIIVDGYSGLSGEYVLHITEFRCDPLECNGTEEIEDNGGCNADTPAFQEIALDETICGTTWCEDGDWDEDWFVFDLSEFYTVSLVVEAYSFDPLMTIISDPVENCTGSTVAAVNTGEFCMAEIYNTILGPGHYYAWIREADTNTETIDAEYSITFTGELYTPPNGDVCETALLIDELPFSASGTTSDNTDSFGNISADEWYELQLPQSSYVFITLCGPNTDFDTYLYLLSDDCATILAHDDDGSVCDEDSAPYEPSEVYQFLPAGDYRLCVEGFNSNSGEYSINITAEEVYCEPLICTGIAEIEDNSGCNVQPPVFHSIALSDTVCGQLWSTPSERDMDWYEFDVSDYSLVTITVNSIYCDPHLIIAADNDQDCEYTVVSDENSGSLCESEMASLVLSPGHYYAGLFHDTYESISGDYSLTLQSELYEFPEIQINPDSVHAIVDYGYVDSSHTFTVSNISDDHPLDFWISSPSPGDSAFSSALGFDGDGDYVSTQLVISDFSQITFEAWVKHEADGVVITTRHLEPESSLTLRTNGGHAVIASDCSGHY